MSQVCRKLFYNDFLHWSHAQNLGCGTKTPYQMSNVKYPIAPYFSITPFYFPQQTSFHIPPILSSHDNTNIKYTWDFL